MIHKLTARHDAFDKALHSSAALHVISQVRNKRQVTDRNSPAEGVADQFVGEGPVEFRLFVFKIIVESGVADDFLSVSKRARIFDRFLIAILIPPTSERIEVLQGESKRVESRMAIVTRRVSAMSFQPFTN